MKGIAGSGLGGRAIRGQGGEKGAPAIQGKSKDSKQVGGILR